MNHFFVYLSKYMSAFFLCLVFPLYSLSLEEKIGYLIVAPICPEHGEEHLSSVRKLLKEKMIKNVIFMAGNSKTQKDWIQVLQKDQDRFLLTFQDAEWGAGMRLKDQPRFPMNMTLGAIENLDLLRAYGRELARQCREAGILVNTAPVVDINSNPKNTVIHRRSFGDDPQRVAEKAMAVLEGMQEGGIFSCLKHFPGHGDTKIDSHFELPIVNKSYSLIEKEELVPYKTLCMSADMVMIGHLLFPNLSEEPASLSKEIITDLLRNSLGFKGVIISDALNMAALKKEGNLGEVFVKALFAGTDLLLTASADPKEIKYLIEEAIPEAIDLIKREVPEAIIDEHMNRILKLRDKSIPAVAEEKKGLKRELYRHAITQLGEKKQMGKTLALVQNHPDVEFENLLRRYADVTVFSYDEMEFAEKCPGIVINVQRNELPFYIPEHATVALFDTPYRLNQFSANHILVGYENVLEAKEAVCDVLFGRLNPLGKLPIQLCTKRNGQESTE